MQPILNLDKEYHPICCSTVAFCGYIYNYHLAFMSTALKAVNGERWCLPKLVCRSLVLHAVCYRMHRAHSPKDIERTNSENPENSTVVSVRFCHCIVLINRRCIRRRERRQKRLPLSCLVSNQPTRQPWNCF